MAAQTQVKAGYIELIFYAPSSEEERAKPEFKPKLEINQEALRLISERFTSPISIIVFTGDMGAGKSKLASLTVATLLQQEYKNTVLPFRSEVDGSNVTRGVWMWRQPLKHLNGKRGSILLLDCEGVNSYNEHMSADLYLFCMMISTVFGVILRQARVDRQLGVRLHDALNCFEAMQTPCILPNLWLVPLELPRLKHSGRHVSELEWIQTVFSSKVAGDTLSKAESDLLEERFKNIREKLRKVDVANITYLPHDFKENEYKINDLFRMLREKPNKDYYQSLRAAIERFTLSAGKRLPGSSSSTLFIRPGELAQFMQELICVINRDKKPNADELIGRHLLRRFNDEVVIEQKVKFEDVLLRYAIDYAKNNLKKIETGKTVTNQASIEAEKTTTYDALTEKRNALIREYSEKMKQLAETKIYGSDSILLRSDLYMRRLTEVAEQMNQYNEPEIFINRMRNIYYNLTDRNNEEGGQEELSPEIEKKLKKKIDDIYYEERVNESLKESELEVDLERCKNCGRLAGRCTMVHSVEYCKSGRIGNYYRYNNEADIMVCDACRETTSILKTPIKCSKCGQRRDITQTP